MPLIINLLFFIHHLFECSKENLVSIYKTMLTTMIDYNIQQFSFRHEINTVLHKPTSSCYSIKLTEDATYVCNTQRPSCETECVL